MFTEFNKFRLIIIVEVEADQNEYGASTVNEDLLFTENYTVNQIRLKGKWSEFNCITARLASFKCLYSITR